MRIQIGKNEIATMWRNSNQVWQNISGTKINNVIVCFFCLGAWICLVRNTDVIVFTSSILPFTHEQIFFIVFHVRRRWQDGLNSLSLMCRSLSLHAACDTFTYKFPHILVEAVSGDDAPLCKRGTRPTVLELKGRGGGGWDDPLAGPSLEWCN